MRSFPLKIIETHLLGKICEQDYTVKKTGRTWMEVLPVFLNSVTA
jgi:hypothetical protein